MDQFLRHHDTSSSDGEQKQPVVKNEVNNFNLEEINDGTDSDLGRDEAEIIH